MQWAYILTRALIATYRYPSPNPMFVILCPHTVAFLFPILAVVICFAVNEFLTGWIREIRIRPLLVHWPAAVRVTAPRCILSHFGIERDKMARLAIPSSNSTSVNFERATQQTKILGPRQRRCGFHVEKGQSRVAESTIEAVRPLLTGVEIATVHHAEEFSHLLMIYTDCRDQADVVKIATFEKLGFENGELWLNHAIVPRCTRCKRAVRRGGSQIRADAGPDNRPDRLGPGAHDGK
jgi:hypothetical protein